MSSWSRSRALAVVVAAAHGAAALGAWTPYTVGSCYAEDVTFLAEADDESVVEVALADCISGNVFVEDTEISTLELPLLESIGGSLVVSFNVTLERVDLPLLREVGGVLEIAANPVLDEVALPDLERVGVLVVTGNDALDEGEVEQALSDVDVSGAATIEP